MSSKLDMSLANVTTGLSLSDNQQSQEILKKFQLAIQRVSSEHGADNEFSLTQDELIRLIRAWEPQRDIICLYVRWARQLRRNFNLDSIATLLCISRQCDYTPIDFLRKVKTLSVHKNQKAAFGITFHFEIPTRQDIDRERLNKEFLGLAVTLSLLQQQVTLSSSILGKTGMRQSSPRSAYAMRIPIEGDDTKRKNATIVAHPTIEFHTQTSLLNRIWKSINHRWLALYLTEHLFREINVPWSYHNALVFTFQMMAPCGPCRFEFLSPIVGYCLRFPTQESIELKRKHLQTIWKDPSSFMSYGLICLSQFATEVKAQIIVSCFQDLRSEIPTTSKKISYNRDSTWLRRWTILRAYIFHFWLDSASNSTIKLAVTSELANRPKKRKLERLQKSNDFSQTIHASMQVQETCTSPTTAPTIGYLSITSSRQRTDSLKTAPTIGCHSITSTHQRTPDTSSQALPNTMQLPLRVAANATFSIEHVDWTALGLITAYQMEKFVKSYLLIHRKDGIDLLAELSPLEVYSADNLYDLVHCRLSGPTPFHPAEMIGPVSLNIRSDADCFLDRASKSYHVARGVCAPFQEYAHILPSMKHVQELCQAIARHGCIDNKRAAGQYRVNIGNGGQNWRNGSPCKLHGMKFQKSLEDDPNMNAEQVLRSIGQLTEFTWRVMCSLQNDANDHPIAPDLVRKQLYASHLNKYLHMHDDVCFEDVTLVVSSLHPVTHSVKPHKDVMNDSVAGYTRTGAFNMVMIEDSKNADTAPVILHFQVICNFRKVIGQFVLPFHKYLAPVTIHARQYLDRWHSSIHSLYAGKTDNIPTVLNRQAFFLDDSLQYQMLAISETGKHKQCITGEYVLTEVGVSRTMSFSMFIDSIVKLQPYLKFDQTLELAFACSFLSNPFWFDWSIGSLIKRLENHHDQYKLGVHPFYDWSQTTTSIFGTWQGGPYNRWSPCGGKETILQVFGAHPEATMKEREEGEKRLTRVISILYNHVEWINSLSDCGKMPVHDMPLASMKAKCNMTISDISKVASCQFGHFRLGIFTTILSGCGLLKEGAHLRNLMYPVKGSASFKHLFCPIADFMSPQRAQALCNNESDVCISNDGEGSVDEEHHDVFMQYLSGELGFKVYARDEIECILCESHPMRSLNCRDWFRKGIALYDCNEKGQSVRREYGKGTTWEKLRPPDHYEFAYLRKPSIVYIPLDAKLTYYANNFGNELRSNMNLIQFKGRNSRTSGQQRTYSNQEYGSDSFQHPSMKMADFYLGSQAKDRKLRSMFVLSDTESAIETKRCNNLEKYRSGKVLYKHLLTLPISVIDLNGTSMAAGCYHMDLEMSNNSVTFFPGHLDKPFVEQAWFVPVGTSSFFTIISVLRQWGQQQDADSLRSFEEWRHTLSTVEEKKVDDFIRIFEVQARKYTGKNNNVTLIYVNKPGSVLSFAANRCYHATITPKKPTGYPRDMIVFHPLDGVS
jgi:hypothetical protein